MPELYRFFQLILNDDMSATRNNHHNIKRNNKKNLATIICERNFGLAVRPVNRST
jgi:hypothetical protein